jgi:hypothetical protein
MKKKILGVAFGIATMTIFTFGFTENSEAKMDPPGGTMYGFTICFNGGNVETGCEMPTIQGPCDWYRACH